MAAFPDLCGYYDLLFYDNDLLSAAIQREDDLLVHTFENREGRIMKIQTAFSSLDDLFPMTGMTSQQFAEFQQAVLSYCKANLVKIAAYMPSPYVTTFRTDQVGWETFWKILGFLF